MKAVVVCEDKKVIIKDIPVCRVSDYDVLCENLCGALCTGTDLDIIDGRLNGISYPTVLGHESIGRVIEVGRKVRNYSIGDIVTSPGVPESMELGLFSNWGGLAEYGIAKDYRAMREDGANENDLVRYKCNQIVPTDISYDNATMIITWRETLSYVKRLKIREGDNVLILGSGSSGLAFAQHAINIGAACFVIGSESNRKYFKAIGVDNYVDYKRKDIIQDIKKNTFHPFDCLIDAIGAPKYTLALLELLADRAVVGIYGLKHGEEYAIDLLKHRGFLTFYTGGYDPEEVHEEVISLIRSKRLKAENWFGTESVFLLNNIDIAVQKLRNREILKALIIIRQDI